MLPPSQVLSLDLYEIADLSRPNKIVFTFVPDFMTILGTFGYLIRFLYRSYRVKKVTKTFKLVSHPTSPTPLIPCPSLPSPPLTLPHPQIPNPPIR